MTADSPALPAKCLKCDVDLASPIVCDGCRTLYPVPQSADYFDLLGVERTYDCDLNKLTAAFRAMTRNIHPDRFNGQPEEVMAMATRLSAQINEAFSVLRNPVRRADYMLELAGGPSAANLREVPGDLLAEVVTLREEVEDAKERNDTASLEDLRSALDERRTETMRLIAARAEQLTTSSESEKNEFRRLVNSIKYFDNLLADLSVDPLSRKTGSEE